MSKENEYIPFHKERIKPVDCYTQSQVNKMLEEQNKLHVKEINDLKIELEKRFDNDITNVVDSWRNRQDGFEERLSNCYVKAEVNEKIHAILERDPDLMHRFDLTKEELYAFKNAVIKHWIDTKQGSMVQGRFVFKRKRW